MPDIRIRPTNTVLDVGRMGRSAGRGGLIDERELAVRVRGEERGDVGLLARAVPVERRELEQAVR